MKLLYIIDLNVLKIKMNINNNQYLSIKIIKK